MTLSAATPTPPEEEIAKSSPRALSTRLFSTVSLGLRTPARHLPTLLFVALASGILFWITWDALRVRLITFNQGSDYWEHTANFRALLDNPWNPANPQVVSPASSPRFGPHFVLYALIARKLHLDAIGAMGVSAILNTAILLGGIYAFFRVYFRSRWAPLLGLLVLFSSWWEGWHFSNVYQLKIYFSVAGYPSNAALGTTLCTFALAVSELRRRAERPGAIAALALLWGVIFTTHPLTAMMANVGGLALAVSEPGVRLRRRFLVGGAVIVGCLLSHFWPYFSPWNVISGGSGVDANWVNQSIDSVHEGGGGDANHQFYRPRELLAALGLAALGVPSCLYLLIRRRHLFIPLGAAAMATPFVVNRWFSVGLGHRFILLAIFFLQVAVVWLLLQCGPPARFRRSQLVSSALRWIVALGASAVLAYFVWVNVDKAVRRFEAGLHKARGGESVYVRYARRIGDIAGRSGVVLAEERNAWPVPTFGTKVVALLHENPLVPDGPARIGAVRRFLRGNLKDSERRAIVEKFRVTHVLVKRSKEGRAARYLSRYGERQSLPGGYVLYAIRR